jgi:pilus assembly protein CpaC
VSSLDVANGVTIAGFTVPGLDIRRVKTEVELQDGQSFAIGGLLDNRETQTLSKIPFIGDVPILGKFFQSIDKRKTNTELIVIVTPEVVAPIPAGAPLPELKFPETFLPSASGIPMTNPGGGVKPAAPTAMPVEKLIQSMQPEQPLNTESTSGYATPTATTTPGNNQAPPPQ